MADLRLLHELDVLSLALNLESLWASDAKTGVSPARRAAKRVSARWPFTHKGYALLRSSVRSVGTLVWTLSSVIGTKVMTEQLGQNKRAKHSKNVKQLLQNFELSMISRSPLLYACQQDKCLGAGNLRVHACPVDKAAGIDLDFANFCGTLKSNFDAA